MVIDRMGPVTSISDPIIYRDRDEKRACVVVTYENDWGEAQAPVAIIGHYNFSRGTWWTDNPHKIDETFDCGALAAERGQILDE